MKDRALVNLVGGNGLGHFRAVEVGALHFGGNQEALRLASEEEHGGVRRDIGAKQIQMDQQFLRFRILGQRKAARAPGFAEKPGHAIRIEVRERGVATGGGVERAGADEFVLLQVLHERGIHAADQLRRGDEPATNQFVADLPDEGAHLGVPGRIVGPFDEDEARFAKLAGVIELAVGRGNATGIFETVFVTEQAKINIASRHFIEIDRIGPAVGRGQIFKQEDFKEATQQRITMKVFLERPSLGGEFLLHAADEDAEHVVASGYEFEVQLVQNCGQLLTEQLMGFRLRQGYGGQVAKSAALAERGIPRGFRLKAQGCAVRAGRATSATLGTRLKMNQTPTGLRPHVRRR